MCLCPCISIMTQCYLNCCISFPGGVDTPPQTTTQQLARWWHHPLLGLQHPLPARPWTRPQECQLRDPWWREGKALPSNNTCHDPGGRFKKAYELLNLRALKISVLYKNHIFQCMGKICCVEFQRVPLKFHTKYLTHTLKEADFIHRWKFKSS